MNQSFATSVDLLDRGFATCVVALAQSSATWLVALAQSFATWLDEVDRSITTLVAVSGVDNNFGSFILCSLSGKFMMWQFWID